MNAGIEDEEGEGRTEERKDLCCGIAIMATHAYMKNQESHLGKEMDMRKWETLVFKGEHIETNTRG